MNKNLRNIYENTIQSKTYNYKKTWAYDFDEEYAEIFADLLLKDLGKIIDDLYHTLPLEQAAVLLTLNEQIEEHFYAKTLDQ